MVSLLTVVKPGRASWHTAAACLSCKNSDWFGQQITLINMAILFSFWQKNKDQNGLIFRDIMLLIMK